MRRPLPLVLGLAACGASDPDVDPVEAAPAAVDGDRYETTLRALAEPRPPGSEGWQRAQDRCADVLAEAGFEVTREDYGTGVNVVGRKAGTVGDHTVVVAAHYDSVPFCTGADDNASGVAGVLEAARALGPHAWRHDLVLACWDEEETGLTGSTAFAIDAVDAGTRFDATVSLEMIGYRDASEGSQQVPTGLDLIFPEQVGEVEARGFPGDFIALFGSEDMAAWTDAFIDNAPEGLATLRADVPDSLLTSPLAADLQRSDHASFWQQGLPGSMVTDTANFRNARYHCTGGPDIVRVLDLEFATDVTRTTVAATAVRLAAGAE